MTTKRIYFITEVVEGGTPGAMYHDNQNIRDIFNTMVDELGYVRDDDHAYDPNDANRNHITLDYIDIPLEALKS